MSKHESLTDLKFDRNVYKIYHCVDQEWFYLKIAQHFYIEYIIYLKINKCYTVLYLAKIKSMHCSYQNPR